MFKCIPRVAHDGFINAKFIF